jgi:hypothetical protein
MLYAALVLFVLCPTLSFAEITKLVIDKCEPFAAGNEFGVTGACEKLIGNTLHLGRCE